MYETKPTGLFATAARKVRYVYHYDRPGEQWNVFKIVYGQEEYVCSFSTAEAASTFCQFENGGG